MAEKTKKIKEEDRTLEKRYDFRLTSQYRGYLLDFRKEHQLSERVIHDLELNVFFEFIDQTHSAIGQQYLYNTITEVEYNSNQILEFEKDIVHYSENESNSTKTKAILSKMDKSTDFYFPYLIFSELPKKLKLFNLLRVLQVISCALLVLAFFKPILILPLLGLLILNTGIHYWHKNKAGNFVQYFYRINKLTNTCRKLLPLSKDKKNNIIESIKNVEDISTSISYLKTDNLKDSEIGSIVWFALELIKILTLSEVILFQRIVEKIGEKRDDLHLLYKYIGKIDTAISIGSLRSKLPYYCKPEFLDSKKKIQVSQIYHPVLKNCIPNDLNLIGKSVLLTGSNMSGKSTFIRSIGINVIAAQTLNTSFSKSYNAPRFSLSTSMKISDNLTENKSYYQEEVLSIGNMLDQAQNETCQKLFIIDEVFKGTNTIERISGGKAILSFLNQNDHIVFVATHDIELTEMLQDEYDLYYFQESIDNEELSFDYKLRQGELQKHNAIKIMEISGYPSSIIDEAKLLAKKLEKEKTNKKVD